MKKSELKSLLKPMIKECIKEVIFEEGILSNIVSEVAQGLGGSTLVEAQHVPATETTPAPAQLQEQEKRASVAKHKAELLAAINKESYGGIDIFEGTNPLSSGGSVEKGPSAQGPLSDIDPGDPGIDISNIVGLAGNRWSAHMK
tara:strand:- start:802 stop:1233 length:432 start_codon:yes stop_codon:yes gene_type:complete